jgi:integrase
MGSEWKAQWGMELKRTRFPGVYAVRESGHYAAAVVLDPKTGRRIPLARRFPEADAPTASRWLEAEKARVRGGTSLPETSTLRFATYVTSEMERRIRDGFIKSAAGRRKWASIAAHIVADPYVGEDGVTRKLGEIQLSQIRLEDFLGWRTAVSYRVDAWRKKRDGKPFIYEPINPDTANDWLSQLKTILRAGHRQGKLRADYSSAIESFDTSDYDPYPKERPNSLSVDEAIRFLDELRRVYPQHYLMAIMGFTLGMRPSTLRPIRWRGPEKDLEHVEGEPVLHVRRSHTEKQEVMRSTKTTLKDEIGLTESMWAIIEWHTRNYARHGSDLLFPGAEGGFLSRSALSRPFQVVGKAIGLTKKISPRGMRRTHKDLMRRASIDHVTAMAMSMHAPAGGSSGISGMHLHYSTVTVDEKRIAVGKVGQLIGLPGGGKPSKKSKPLLKVVVTEPPRQSHRHFEIEGVVRTLTGWAESSGIAVATLSYRLMRGLTMPQAIALGGGRRGRSVLRDQPSDDVVKDVVRASVEAGEAEANASESSTRRGTIL